MSARFRDALRAWFQEHLITVLSLVRRHMPIVTLGGRYALVTRADDVRAVLEDEATFGVTYEPKMRVVTGGENFFLGMHDTPRYHRDVHNWHRVFPAAEAETVVGPLVRETATELVRRLEPDVDVVRDVAAVVPCVTVERYMGVTGPSRPELVEWTSALFAYLFYPSKPGAADAQAGRIAGAARDHIDDLIAERKQSGAILDDGLGRALSMQANGVDGMDDVSIRNNLLGIVIGAVPTTSKCVALVLDHLLDHPDRMAGAREAALVEDWSLLNGYVDEALRFNPFGPVLLRTCNRTHRLAAGTDRARTIRSGTLVAVGTLPAMWDPDALVNPEQFDPTRPSDVYLTYGHGMHTCFGTRINAVQIAAIVSALLIRAPRRAAAGLGTLEVEGQFPAHLRVRLTE